MRTSTLFGAKYIGFFGIYDVSARTRKGREVESMRGHLKFLKSLTLTSIFEETITEKN